MSKKKSVFDESCKLFNDKSFMWSEEEYSVLNEFCEFEKFVDDTVVFFYSHFSLEDLDSMKITIVKFIIDNQKIFGFHTTYNYQIYYDLVIKSISDMRD